MNEAVRAEALNRYSHKNVRDRYDADLLMAGFSDGAKWAIEHGVDFCYECNRTTLWSGETCTGCGREWGHDL